MLPLAGSSKIRAEKVFLQLFVDQLWQKEWTGTDFFPWPPVMNSWLILAISQRPNRKCIANRILSSKAWKEMLPRLRRRGSPKSYFINLCNRSIDVRIAINF